MMYTRLDFRTTAVDRSRQAAGFSLIQLLVSCAIIAVLMGMLVPSISAIRAMVKRTTCQANLRQWGLAALGYAQDHRGRVPYSITYWDGPSPLFGKTPYAAWKVPMPGLEDELTYATCIDYLESDPSRRATLGKIWTCPTGNLSSWDQDPLGYPCLFMDYTYFALRDTPQPAWCNAPDQITIRIPRADQVLAGDNVARSMHGIWYFRHGRGLDGTPDLSLFRGSNQLFSDGRAAWRAAADWPVEDMVRNSNGGFYLGDCNNNRSYF